MSFTKHFLHHPLTTHIHQEKQCGVRTPLWCLLTPVSRPCFLGIHMSPVTTPMPFYSTSSLLLPILTHVVSPSHTVRSPSHAPHLHSDIPPAAPHDPLPYPHVSTGSCASSAASYFDIFIPLSCIQLVPCAKIYSIIDQPQAFRI